MKIKSSPQHFAIFLLYVFTRNDNHVIGFTSSRIYSTTITRNQLQSSFSLPVLSSSPTSAQEEAKRLLEKAAEIRKQLAELEGKSVSQVEKEAKDEKESRQQLQQEQERQRLAAAETGGDRKVKNRNTNQLIYVPETIDDQIRQASLAIERAFQDKITRQTVRLALVKENQRISPEEEEWPGGAKQMYREAGRPLTEALLSEIRAVAKNLQTEEEINSGKDNYPPTIKAQDIWDFDVSCIDIIVVESLHICSS